MFIDNSDKKIYVAIIFFVSDIELIGILVPLDGTSMVESLRHEGSIHGRPFEGNILGRLLEGSVDGWPVRGAS